MALPSALYREIQEGILRGDSVGRYKKSSNGYIFNSERLPR